MIYVQGLVTKTQKPCTLEDLGISTITQEKIALASFDSQNPILNYDIQNLSQVEELLRTLQGAVFYKAYASPQEPIHRLSFGQWKTLMELALGIACSVFL